MTIFIIILSILGAAVGLIGYLGNRGRRKEKPEPSTQYGGYLGSVAGKKSAGVPSSSVSSRGTLNTYYPSSRNVPESRRDDSTDMLLTGMILGSMNNDSGHSHHSHSSDHSSHDFSGGGGSFDGGGSSGSWDSDSSSSDSGSIHPGYSMIEVAYCAVIEFIKWYNSPPSPIKENSPENSK